ncbi:ribosome maturation factor RimP [Acetivibrio cellulolyticus]|uniref:ribosome maturation factor RimP n=1 Tax=Acetivibrio cellulolyticus TaxID=35830 RepID=UPI0001E2C25F|nr:ribosome maturation factor RimP [Acetivibrio cellulolyticus]
MVKRKIEEIVAEFAEPVVANHYFELVDVEFIKEGTNWYLRIYIDKPGGITIDDCQIISEEISDILDKKDPIEQSYFLEVSSPGLDRPLKKESDFERFKGELVEVKVFKPIDGRKIFEGNLLGLIDNKIIIKINDTNMEFERDQVALVRRVIKF